MAFTKYLLPALAAAGTVLGTPDPFPPIISSIETKQRQDVRGRSSLKEHEKLTKCLSMFSTM
jgi:hypothetical protein